MPAIWRRSLVLRFWKSAIPIWRRAISASSEQAIAAAFEEAADLGAFLILDEADSLLRDRGAARHSWEITQVNEMLTWMERHPFPFACTTNAPECSTRRRPGAFCSRCGFYRWTKVKLPQRFLRLSEPRRRGLSSSWSF